jgi:alpha-tubulin suppressor-like RCC1 family protein
MQPKVDGIAPNYSIPVLVPGAPPFVRISAGEVHACGVAPTRDVWCWGSNSFGQVSSSAPGDAATPVLVSLP